MELVAEGVLVAVEETWQMLPDMALGAVDIPNDCLHLLRTGEAVPIRQSLILLQKVLNWLFNVAQKARREF